MVPRASRCRNVAAHSSAAAPAQGELGHNIEAPEGRFGIRLRWSIVREEVKSPDPTSKPETSKQAAAGKVRHDGGRAVWQWAADTARHVALSASQVLRKLDASGLKLEDDAERGKPSARPGASMPGGGTNPYDSRPVPRGRRVSGSAAKPRSPGLKPARASWWSRLFRRG